MSKLWRQNRLYRKAPDKCKRVNLKRKRDGELGRLAFMTILNEVLSGVWFDVALSARTGVW